MNRGNCINLDEMKGDDKLTLIAEALKDLTGYFVLTLGDEELVVLKKEVFERLNKQEDGVQLEFKKMAVFEDDEDQDEEDLELVNRELATQQTDYNDMGDRDMEVFIDEQLGESARKKVRFEPLRGDLSPDLQE